MLFREIAEKVKSNEITIDLCGHKTYRDVREHLIDEYEDLVKDSLGASDGKWNKREDKSSEVTDQSMREFFKNKLDFKVEEGEEICSFTLEHQECKRCGERLGLVLNGNVLSLRFYFNGKDFLQHPPEYVCPFVNPQPFKGQIEIASKMIFANFFNTIEDEPESEKYQPEYSINSLQGRVNVAKFKEKHNIAYGQMTNTSIGIFLHPDKKSIIIGNPYIADDLMEELSEEEYDKADEKDYQVIEGHKMIGDIGLEVWRWEATDVKTLDKNYKKIKAEMKKRNIDIVEVDVEHGTWEFEHYFDTQTSPDENIYARLTKK